MKMREKTMKRMIGVSIAAMLVAVPMLANAEPVAGVSISDGDKGVISSKAYVKGAYNAAIGAVNAVDAAVSTRQAQLVNDAETPASVGSIVKTTVSDATNASDTALVTEKAVRDAIDNATPNQDLSAAAGDALLWDGTNSKLNIDLAANGGLATDNNKLKVSVDNSTIEANADGQLQVKNGGIAFAKLNSSDVKTTVATENPSNVALVTEAAVRGAVDARQAQLVNDAETPANMDSTVKTAIADANNASNTALVTEAAVRGAVDARQAQLVNDAETPVNMDSTVKTAVADANNASNTALVTEAAVRTAVDAVANAAGQNLSAAAGDALAWNGTTSKLDVNLTTNGGLQTIAGANANDPSSLGVKVDDSTIEIDSTYGKVQVKDGGIAFAKLNSAAVKTTVATENPSNVALVTEAAVRGAVDARQAQLVNDAETPANMVSTVKTAVADANDASDTALVTEKAVRDAVDAVAATTTNAATQTGVSETIAATTITVPVYTTWNTSTTQNVTATVTKPTYTTGTPPA